MENFSRKFCKYCKENLIPCLDEGLICSICKLNVHLRCLKRGSVPGGLAGDLFYIFTCIECNLEHSGKNMENFIRQKMSWLQVILVTLYDLKVKSGGLSNSGFYHWRYHIVGFIDRHWDVLFPNGTQRKKKWVGTVSGRLSYHSGSIFASGSKTAFNKPAWWTLMYPKVTPFVISEVYNALTSQKDKKLNFAEHFKTLLGQYVKNDNLMECVDLMNDGNIKFENITSVENEFSAEKKKSCKTGKTKNILPIIISENAKKVKLNLPSSQSVPENKTIIIPKKNYPEEQNNLKRLKLLDPLCYYNTSLSNISRLKMTSIRAKLTGNIRKELILSPYSGIYLKPFIRRDLETYPCWLKLMAELQLTVNNNNNKKNKETFQLPLRSSLDYTYVQPEHIPAINSLCNQFFWPGIDVTDSLQYPEYSCIAIYKKLIIGFAFLVPDVKHTENYLSFLFTRPGWRNCGIGKFMIYHLIQTSLGKDLTLHVSIDNPAIFLYQKFGFKVENVVLDFYDKYFRDDVSASKNAFFCRLER